MTLMATFSPVRMCRPNLTLAKPPEKQTKKKKTTTFSVRRSLILDRWGCWTGRYLNRWSHKPCSICGALRLHRSPSFASASFLQLPEKCVCVCVGGGYCTLVKHLKQKSDPIICGWTVEEDVAALYALKRQTSCYLLTGYFTAV